MDQERPAAGILVELGQRVVLALGAHDPKVGVLVDPEWFTSGAMAVAHGAPRLAVLSGEQRVRADEILRGNSEHTHIHTHKHHTNTRAHTRLTSVPISCEMNAMMPSLWRVRMTVRCDGASNT